MAKVNMGAIVVGIRGTVGGLTFSANKSGNHVKLWGRPANVRTSLQDLKRTGLSTIAQHWRALSASNKSDWNTLAALEPLTDAFGNTYYLSGFQRFQKFNIHRASVARAILDAPPIESIPAAPTIASVTVSAGAVACTYTYAAGQFGPTYDAVLFINLAPTTGPLAPPGSFQFIKGSQVPGGTSITFTTELFALFPKPNAFQRAFWRIARQLPSGFRSDPTSGYVDVIA